MTNKEQSKIRRPWSWKQFCAALALAIVGLLSWFLGLCTALYAGSSGTRDDDWLVSIAEHFFRIGPYVVGLALIWLLLLLVRRFWPKKVIEDLSDNE